MIGLVFPAAVVFHLSTDQPQRLARLRQMFRFGGKLERQPAPPQGSLSLRDSADRERSAPWSFARRSLAKRNIRCFACHGRLRPERTSESRR